MVFDGLALAGCELGRDDIFTRWSRSNNMCLSGRYLTVLFLVLLCFPIIWVDPLAHNDDLAVCEPVMCPSWNCGVCKGMVSWIRENSCLNAECVMFSLAYIYFEISKDESGQTFGGLNLQVKGTDFKAVSYLWKIKRGYKIKLAKLWVKF